MCSYREINPNSFGTESKNLNLMRHFYFLIIISTLFALIRPQNAQAFEVQQIALIYSGPGSCAGCPEAVGKVLGQLGYKIRYIKPADMTSDNFKSAHLYVQPGGSDFIEYTLNALSFNQINELKKFIYRGGHYLGICAGGYLAGNFATEERKKSHRKIRAFGLIDIDEVNEEIEDNFKPFLIDVRWQNQNRKIYFQAGPHFGEEFKGTNVKIYARYSRSNRIAALMTSYGSGKVGLIGPHPEASTIWYIEDQLSTNYGLNTDLITHFIHDLNQSY